MFDHLLITFISTSFILYALKMWINSILFSSNIMYNHQQLHSRLAWPSMKKHNVFEQSKNRTSEIILTTEQFTLTREG